MSHALLERSENTYLVNKPLEELRKKIQHCDEILRFLVSSRYVRDVAVEQTISLRLLPSKIGQLDD